MRGIKINRSSGEPTAEEFNAYKEQFMTSYSERVTTDDRLSGDSVVCDITFTHDGKMISEAKNVTSPCSTD